MRATLLALLLGCGRSPAAAQEPLPSNKAETTPADAAPPAHDDAAVFAHDGAREEIERLTHLRSVLDRKISEVVDSLATAQSDDERTRYRQALRVLQETRADIDMGIAQQRELSRGADRGSKEKRVPEHCAQTPTAKECI